MGTGLAALLNPECEADTVPTQGKLCLVPIWSIAAINSFRI